MSLAIAYHMKRKGKKMAKGGEPKKDAAFKDKKNPDASDQVKASARAKRNARGIKTPEGEYKRYFKFDAKRGALPGKPGDKVYGRPKDSYKETGVHKGDDDRNDLRGRSAAGITGEWATKHTRNGNHGLAQGAMQKSKELHGKKLEELKSMSGPTSGKAGFAKGGDAGSYRETGYEKGVHTKNGSAQKAGTGHMGSRNRQTQYSSAGHAVRDAHQGNTIRLGPAKRKHEQVLEEMRSMPNPKLPMAEGGSVCAHCGGYAEGGEALADFDSADFDAGGFEGTEANYTGANSGDELGDEGEEQRRKKSALLSYLRRKSA